MTTTADRTHQMMLGATTIQLCCRPDCNNDGSIGALNACLPPIDFSGDHARAVRAVISHLELELPDKQRKLNLCEARESFESRANQCEC
mmetsp:Transcript_25070/g.68891  ORF Transcript_25070/g.68891 Transcript_25070/m.68891 type:complete len:89 (-) Transcript_25070:931-1197(-)